MIFKKRKPTDEEDQPKSLKTKLKVYPNKIILAWAKSLEGNKEITQWLLENGFEELVQFNQAVYLKQVARDWLMENGYPHLMAYLNAAEGNEKAQHWLKNNGFPDLYYSALAVEGEKEGWEYMNQKGDQELFFFSQILKSIKDKIEERHNDIHSFGSSD